MQSQGIAKVLQNSFDFTEKYVAKVLQSTVWKSTLKCYHAKKFSVKPQNKFLLIPLLQMHDFLPLGGTFGSNRLNQF